MDRAPAVLVANQRVPRSRPEPRLKLLIEWESRRRVFLGNLADLLLSRRPPQITLTSRPARFWNDVFVPTGAPWTSFMESMLWHALLVVLFLWAQSRIWVPVKRFQQKDSSRITYYRPSQSFPAAEGRAAKVRPRTRVKAASAPQAAMPVTPERKPSLVTPPDIKQAAARLPDFPSSHAVTPMVPFSATTSRQRNALAGAAGSSGAVAPPPQVDQATARRLGLPQASAIAPAPNVEGTSSGRTVNAPNTGGLRVVPPPPSAQNAGTSATAGRLALPQVSAVAPAPDLGDLPQDEP